MSGDRSARASRRAACAAITALALAAAHAPGRGLTPAGAAVLANCAGASTGLTPLDALGGGVYQGHGGGLYGEGANAPPPAHAALAAARAARVTPRAADGAPAADGRVVLLSLGMSNATQSFSRFVRLAEARGGLHPRLTIVDGAQGGQTAAVIRDPSANFWRVVDQRLQAAGVTAAQVQAVWIKEADANPRTGFPAYARTLADELAEIARLVAVRFPNVQLAYLSSRTYGGYASTALNPEPYAYESAFSVQWLIRRQIDGAADLNADPSRGAVVAPVLLWGPYLWADGLRARADGLWYACSDFADDGTHPSPEGGRPKVAALLDDFFRRDATARTWFVADPAAPPPPPLAWPPPPTRGPTATPGGATPSRPAPTSAAPRPTPPPLTPGAPHSFRVHERPSGATIWLVTDDDTVVRRLRMLAASPRPAWLCGTVAGRQGWEGDFTLEPPGLALDLAAPPAERQSTIHAIRADLAALTGQARCIQIDRVTDESLRSPPGVPPLHTLTPTPSAGPTRASDATPTAPPPPSGTPTSVAHPSPPEPSTVAYLPLARRD